MTTAPHLWPNITARLVTILGMFGSDYDGEIAATGRRANTMVNGAGLMWDEVITSSAPIPQQPYRPSRRWRRPTSPSDTAALCLLWPKMLTDWETNFCRSIVGRRRISAKQTVVLERLARKVEAFASVTGED